MRSSTSCIGLHATQEVLYAIQKASVNAICTGVTPNLRMISPPYRIPYRIPCFMHAQSDTAPSHHLHCELMRSCRQAMHTFLMNYAQTDSRRSLERLMHALATPVAPVSLTRRRSRHTEARFRLLAKTAPFSSCPLAPISPHFTPKPDARPGPSGSDVHIGPGGHVPAVLTQGRCRSPESSSSWPEIHCCRLCLHERRILHE